MLHLYSCPLLLRDAAGLHDHMSFGLRVRHWQPLLCLQGLQLCLRNLVQRDLTSKACCEMSWDGTEPVHCDGSLERHAGTLLAWHTKLIRYVNARNCSERVRCSDLSSSILRHLARCCSSTGGHGGLCLSSLKSGLSGVEIHVSQGEKDTKEITMTIDDDIPSSEPHGAEHIVPFSRLVPGRAPIS